MTTPEVNTSSMADNSQNENQEISARPVGGRLSLLRVVAEDYLAFIAVTYPVMVWVGYAIFLLIGKLGQGRHDGWFAAADSAPVFYGLGLVLTGIGLPLLGWRLYWLQRVLVNGLAVPGKVQKVLFKRELIEVEYTYHFAGKLHRHKASLHRTARTRTLQPKEDVDVIVDRKHPQRSFLGDLLMVDSEGQQQ